MGIDFNLAMNGEGKKKKSSKGSSIIDRMVSNALGQVGGYDAIFGAKKQYGSLAEAIEKQAANQKHSAEQKSAESMAPSMDPMQALQQQLFSAVNGISVAATPLEQLQKMANAQVSAQFDPQIQALMSDMGNKGKRARRSQSEAKGMYGALSKDYMSELPAMTEQFAAEDKATDARYDDAQKTLNDQYSGQAQQQDSVLKNLGITAAAGGASEQAKTDQAYFQNQLETDQNSARNALDQQQMAAQTYQQNLGDNAKMAGTNAVSDIETQLQDYLDQANGQLSGLQGQKQGAIAALLAQMQQQDQQRVQDQGQQEMDNLMKLFNFQLSATDKSMDNQLQMTKLQNALNGGSGGTGAFKGTSGLAGASNYLAGQYPDQPILASHLMENINNVLSNKDVVNGKFVLDQGDKSMGKGPTYSNVGQEYMMDLLRSQFEKQGSQYGTGDINNTMNALLAYMGKLR